MEQSNASDSSQQQPQPQPQPPSTEQNQQQQQPQQQQQQRQQQAPPQAVPVPQPWVPMQYPAAAMVMQHRMMPPQHYAAPPHYVPYHPHQYHVPPHVTLHQQNNQHQNGSNGGENNKTVWIGDLHHWMDENYLHRCFASTGEITSIKVIRNKHTGLSEGYGFVEFHSHATAEKVLQSYAAILMPNTDQPFRLNWATFSTADKSSDNVPDLSIFVGDLAADVTDSMLHETFASVFPSVKAAKVVFDANTGRSKGYGFVRFGDDSERTKAMTQMNGVYCSSRPMRIGAATPRKSAGHQGGQGNGTSSQSEVDLTNTTIFVGGLDPDVTDEDLRQPFSQYGEIISVKIPVGKGCGFVQFANRTDAEEAKEKLNGTKIGKQQVRLSWGRSPANKQHRMDYGNTWSGGYYGAPIYDGYGYALPPPHDPTIYAAAYGAYPFYGGHQQQVS